MLSIRAAAFALNMSFCYNAHLRKYRRESGAIRHSYLPHFEEKLPLDKQKRKTLVETYRRHEKDTGSTEVQVSLLTEKINVLTGHLKKYAKDNLSRHGLFKSVGQRRRLLAYLGREDVERYQKIITQLGLRK
jgi:small subunit ribosomal protein S15